MKTLLIETATQVCSVALADGRQTVQMRESAEPNAHSSHLVPFVQEMLEQQGWTMNGLDAVCVSSGPGSYTGLRIGVSSAKGFCYGAGLKLLSVPTLLSMANLYYRRHPEYKGVVCPMIDARRMECYTMIVGRDESGVKVLRDTQADIITEGIYDEWLDRGEVTFVGDGADKTRPVLGVHRNARFDADFAISAEGMLDMAYEKYGSGNYEDVAYFEPFYLKDFVAKKSVVHGLRS